MASSRRNFLLFNLALAGLIGGMIWYLSQQGQTLFINLPSSPAAPVASTTRPATTNATNSPAGSDQAIVQLQAQLRAEKARAEKARTQILARERDRNLQASAPSVTLKQNTLPQPAVSSGLEVEQQKQRIAAMIHAQSAGARNENQRLNQAPQQKNQEVEVTKHLIKLDNSAQALLATLLKNGNNISSSDQQYINAMQEPEEQIGTPQNTEDTDLINRVEVADSGDEGSLAARLRNVVGELMENKDSKAKQATEPKATVSPPANDLQGTINAIMARNEERKQQRQLASDVDYLDSLTPVEKERRNETRWVTVREGDTLYDISTRVYKDGWLYQKIFDANPQVLNNPDRIKPGQRLRVPL
jgi:nucleoid-associated protein YgaU